MTPTIEEVKNVAVMCGFGSSDPKYDHIPSYEELQAFAQHYKKEGRDEQREIDIDTCKEFYSVDGTAQKCAEAIRNNTGE